MQQFSRRLIRRALGVGLLVPVLLVGSGCESEDSLPGDAAFHLTPGTVTLTPSEPTVVLQVVGGHAPFTWTVSGTNMGSLDATMGTSATFTRGAADGVVTVVATDNLQWKAGARIYMEQDPVVATNAPTPLSPLTVTPAAPSLASNGSQIMFTAAGGVPPYHWSILDGVQGHFVSGSMTSTTIIYTRDLAGDNALVLTDSEGSTVTVVISQP